MSVTLIHANFDAGLSVKVNTGTDSVSIHRVEQIDLLDGTVYRLSTMGGKMYTYPATAQLDIRRRQ